MGRYTLTVRLHHLAELCQCSQATVSRALRNESTISSSVRAKIQNVAMEMGYRRHSAKLLRNMRTVAVIHSSFSGLLPEIAAELHQPEEKDGISFMFLEHSGEPAREEVLVMAARQFASALIVPTANAALLAKLNKPVFSPKIAPSTDKTAPIAGIRLNDRAGTFEATDYLVHLGHKEIAFLNGPIAYPCSYERREGFLDAMKQHALKVPVNFVVEGGFSSESGMERTRQLLASPHPPTAIVTAYDALAKGAIRAATDADLRVPEDLSVVGFGNFHAAVEFSPGLTTIEYPLNETLTLVLAAAQSLLSKEALCEQPERMLKPRLRLRESCTYRE